MISIKKLVRKSDIRYDKVVNACLSHEVIVPLDVAGRDCSVKISPNEVVKEGQIIATDKLSGFNIHSPIPGIVDSIYEHIMPDGKLTSCVKIRLKGEFSFLGKIKKEADFQKFSQSQLTRIIANKGISNTFSGTIPLIDEISASATAPRNLLVRLYDGDPTCCIDGFVTHRFFHKVYIGALLTAKAMDAKAVIFVTDEHLTPPTPPVDVDLGIEVHFSPMNISYYQCAEKKEIIQIIMHSKLKKSAVNLSFDDLAIDSVTALSVFEAVCYGKPVLDRYVLISGDAVRTPEIFNVKIGTPIENLLRECSGFKFAPDKVVINGVFKGTAIENIKTPIAEYVKSVCCFKNGSWSGTQTSECINCGKCHYVCPVGIYPDKLYHAFINKKNIAKEYVESAKICCDCKVCNSVCPSRLSLFQAIRELQKVGK